MNNKRNKDLWETAYFYFFVVRSWNMFRCLSYSLYALCLQLSLFKIHYVTSFGSFQCPVCLWPSSYNKPAISSLGNIHLLRGHLFLISVLCNVNFYYPCLLLGIGRYNLDKKLKNKQTKGWNKEKKITAEMRKPLNLKYLFKGLPAYWLQHKLWTSRSVSIFLNIQTLTFS